MIVAKGRVNEVVSGVTGRSQSEVMDWDSSGSHSTREDSTHLTQLDKTDSFCQLFLSFAWGSYFLNWEIPLLPTQLNWDRDPFFEMDNIVLNWDIPINQTRQNMTSQFLFIVITSPVQCWQSIICDRGLFTSPPLQGIYSRGESGCLCLSSPSQSSWSRLGRIMIDIRVLIVEEGVNTTCLDKQSF